MDETHPLSPATRAALVALSQGSCDFPGCRTPVMVFLDNEPAVNVEPVRIHPDGPRDGFDNLVLLCVPHRKTVDRDRAAHPAPLLQTWKQTPPGPLSELRNLTESHLDTLLIDAFGEAREQLDQALIAFEKVDPTAAALLRERMTTLHDNGNRNGADPRLIRHLTMLDRKVDAVLHRVEERPPRPPRLNVGWRTPAS